MAHYIDNFPGRKIAIKGKAYLYFGGTSYLGLQTDTEFQDTLIKNVQKYGTNYGASRNSNVRFSIYKKVEAYLAHLVGSNTCVTLSSGYLAGQFVAQYFNTTKYKLFYAPNTHSALHLATNIKQAVTFASLNIAVREHLDGNSKSTPVVLLDSIDFSGAHYPDFEGLKQLPLENVILIADDSHGIGVIGSNGSGVFGILKSLKPKELIVCTSLGKGFGIQAGAIFGTNDRMEQLRKTPFFGGASPAAPAYLATLLESKELYLEKRRVMAKNIAHFLENVKERKRFNFMQGHPAFSYSNVQLTNHLFEHGVILTDFNYPNEHAGLKSRIVLSAHHTKQDILDLTALINAYKSY
ncbi:aminotransferase class I/II-fold pyridoxal phosphate-dependent enzyme [Ulvibacterium sp.]|uniref:aminotransferase class I/II-fold pyridoxal phosphate-dependent enzyme n=1 Tax=Ulvibacterium sp. TaxID=2665914 RepID=UPI00260CAAFD|nr:aminotransferase class I/II-fold pyridoxal phosphate-dependent enzyme [Ulvibacterium sp.]